MRQGQVYAGQAFATLYTYLESDLGVSCSAHETCFRLWAPTASTANVLLYDTGQPIADETPRSIPMHRGDGGTWMVRVADDLKGKYYTYQVQIDGRWNEAVDPYARAAGLNGRRGKIIDLSATDPAGWKSDARPRHKDPTDAIIYELHIRDLSSHPQSGINHKGKFLGLTESGTTTPNGVKTGLDHITELGVTHVHLLPCFGFEYGEDAFPPPGEAPYNWGYNPKNYNAPEDSYATNPIDGVTAVRELKRLIQTLHSRGIGVIMDVVYNHVYDADNSSFGLLAPGYYFRMKNDGYSNGSGCGNETASERVMMRKFMVDSVVYWAEEYHIDGFRFDLMGLHDIETMNLIRARLDEIDPGILMYGEGWVAGQSALAPSERAVKDNAFRLNSRIAMFSDDIRDSVRGGNYDAKASGFVNGSAAERAGDVKFGFAAAVQHPQVDPGNRFWAKHPSQTVTYVSCHDDLTLWDKLVKTNPTASTKELAAMNRLAAAIALTSQGLVLLHAGEEMARTKNGSDNSYNAPDSVNRLDWPRKRGFNDLFEYYKGLIAIRRNYPAFRMADAESLRAGLRFIETGAPEVV
ncbi:MAG: type I pullulanase, partial [Oscillospiraceae bacterium]|nr:type I pullulanase [Oscillospiraceae bacterium]